VAASATDCAGGVAAPQATAEPFNLSILVPAARAQRLVRRVQVTTREGQRRARRLLWRLLGFHPDDTTLIPRPSRYYGPPGKTRRLNTSRTGNAKLTASHWRPRPYEAPSPASAAPALRPPQIDKSLHNGDRAYALGRRPPRSRRSTAGNCFNPAMRWHGGRISTSMRSRSPTDFGSNRTSAPRILGYIRRLRSDFFRRCKQLCVHVRQSIGWRLKMKHALDARRDDACAG
jgi:hypothetical protein